MSLRRQIILAIGTCMVSLAALVYWVSDYALQQDLLEHEQVDAISNLESTADRLSYEGNHLKDAWLDWSLWDQMYEFAQERQSTVLESSLTNVQLKDNRVNLLAILNRQGKSIFATEFDLQTTRRSPLSANTKTYLRQLASKINQPSQQIWGLGIVEQQPMLLTLQPITRSNAQAPIGGVLITGKLIDQNLIRSLYPSAQAQITISSIYSPNLSPNEQFAIKAMQVPELIAKESTPPKILEIGSQRLLSLVKLLPNQRIGSYALLKDLSGAPVLLLNIEKNRLSYEKVRQGFGFLYLIFGVGAVIIGLAILWIIDQIILSRLIKISSEVAWIGNQSDLSQRIFVQGEDEISKLVKTINQMLSAIEYRHYLQAQVEEEKEALFRVSRAINCAIDYETALSVALQELAEILGADYGEIWTLSADGLALILDKIWYGPVNSSVTPMQGFREFSEGITLLAGEELPGKTWQTGQPELISDLNLGKDSSLRQQMAISCGFVSQICLPILKQVESNQLSLDSDENKLTPDLLCIFSFFSTKAAYPDSQQLQLVSAMNNQLAVVLRQRQIEAELKALFASMNEGIVVVDSQGYYLRVAPTNTQVLPVPSDQLIGKRIDQVFPKSQADKLMGYIKQVLNQQTMVYEEYEVELNLKPVWVGASFSPISEEEVLWVI